MEQAIDRWITADLGGRQTQALYAAAREENPPLTQTAAERLLGVGPDESMVITTGFPVFSSDTDGRTGGTDAVVRAETDGLLGAVVLAHALETLGVRPVFVVEPFVEPVVSRVAAAVGLSPTIDVVDDTPDSEPAAVVAIERPGRSADGEYRNMAGETITDFVTPTDSLFEQASLAVAVGDGGNEVGMGAIQSTVASDVPHGGSIAAVTPADALVVGGVSNWGAYGIVAQLSLATGQNLMHTAATERELLAAAVSAGACDGVTGESTLSVDGISVDVHATLVAVLRAAVADALADQNEI